MQDVKRIQDQVDEIALKAEVRASVAEDHRQIALQRRDTAERELAKFRALHESFTVGEQLLLQRRQQLLAQEQPPGPPVLEGIVGAIEQLQNLQKQAQEMILKHEGAFMAFQAFEETFREQQVQATSRARGMEVQGARAVGVAERREEGEEASEATEEPPEATEEPSPEPKSPKGADGEDSAKEPIGRSRKKAGKKRSRRKPEP
ncbi:MAG: hypothetical protein JSV19_00555 [Phycisphaerales bacterium]|nr:MAG: hypothetical protein JSV19_00555 [Phycisphaerales bacterium]